MTALEIRQDEIGAFDYEAYKARRARMMPAPKRAQPRPMAEIPARVRLARVLYSSPIGPVLVINFGRDWLDIKTDCDPFRVQRIINETMEKHGIGKKDFFSDRRMAHIVLCRHEAAYRLRHETKLSFPQIAKTIGREDHSTAIWAVKQFTKLLEAGEVTVGIPNVEAAE